MVAVFKVLYENDDLVAVSKLGPLPVQKDASGDSCLTELVTAWLSDQTGRIPERCEAAHRLDRPVSGLVLFAKRTSALRALSQAFREQRVDKRYLAAVAPAPQPPASRLHHLIGWNKARSKAFVGPIDPALRGGKQRPDMKEASLEYQTLATGHHYSLLEVRLISGRHHQIRAQLAAIGSPIKGDVKYGARRPNPAGLISLHAWKLVLPPEFAVPPLEAAPPDNDGVWAIL